MNDDDEISIAVEAKYEVCYGKDYYLGKVLCVPMYNVGVTHLEDLCQQSLDLVCAD